jgi:hypothetical protein
MLSAGLRLEEREDEGGGSADSVDVSLGFVGVRSMTHRYKGRKGCIEEVSTLLQVECRLVSFKSLPYLEICLWAGVGGHSALSAQTWAR